MYSVLRFYSEDVALLAQLGEEINSCEASAFSGIDKAGERFSISVSETDIPSHHMREILKAIALFDSVISSAIKLNVRVEIDTAIEPEDLQGRLYSELEISNDFMGHLARRKINYRLTVYSPK